MGTWAAVLCIVFVLMIIFYVIWLCITKEQIVVSTFSSDAEVTGDQFYFLPTASLSLTATASIIITRSATDNQLLNAVPGSLHLEPEVCMEPDTEQLFSITYKSSIFFNDELRINTNAHGLLENIAATTEDRITNIIGQIADAPARILSGAPPIGRSMAATAPKVVQQNIITEVKEFTRIFKVSSKEVQQPSMTVSWFIPIEGQTAGNTIMVDTSFTIKRTASTKATLSKKAMDGLYTRPLQVVPFDVYQSDGGSQVTDFSCLLPNLSKFMLIPLKRYTLVKGVCTPKFSEGLLVENYVNKPSQVEAAVSIPINILKAIVSIPAQLLSFKITRNNQQATYEKSVQDLARAQADTQKQLSASADATNAAQQQLTALHTKSDDLQKTIDTLKTQTTAPAFPAPKIPLPKLGKAPATGTASIAAMVKSLVAGAAALPVPLDPVDWQKKFGGAWPIYNNEVLATCVPAAAAYMIITWTANSRPPGMVPKIDDIMALYNNIVAYTGNCTIRSLLDRWVSTGINGDMISKYHPIKCKDKDELKTAVFYFGGCLIGLRMPITALGQSTWDMTPSGLNDDGTPGSWGGHAVPVVGYTGDNFIVISRGTKITMTSEFYKNYNDESFALLSKADWIIAASGNAPDPCNTDFNTLSTVMDNLA